MCRSSGDVAARDVCLARAARICTVFSESCLCGFTGGVSDPLTDGERTGTRRVAPERDGVRRGQAGVFATSRRLAGQLPWHWPARFETALFNPGVPTAPLYNLASRLLCLASLPLSLALSCSVSPSAEQTPRHQNAPRTPSPLLSLIPGHRAKHHTLLQISGTPPPPPHLTPPSTNVLSYSPCGMLHVHTAQRTTKLTRRNLAYHAPRQTTIESNEATTARPTAHLCVSVCLRQP